MTLPQEIAQALARGATVLTGSPRSARALTLAHADEARARSVGSWQAPRIHDWAAWLEALYAQLGAGHDVPALLTPMQEEHLWQRVQAQDARAVVSPERLAELAGSAYGLLGGYNAHHLRRAPWAAAHEDAERFLTWAASFDELCGRLGVLSRSHLEEHLANHAGGLRAPEEILLTGFDLLTPAQTALLKTVAARGTAIRRLDPENDPPQQQIISADDEGAELRACALWLRKQLERDPKQRIGVLVPSPERARPELDRVLRRTLQPAAASRPAGPALPYEFALGTPLANIPVIAAALLFLRWLGGALPSADVSALLLGGFFAGTPEEARALAQTDAALRRRGLLTAELNLRTLLRHADRNPDLLPRACRDRFRAAADALLPGRDGPKRRGKADPARKIHGEWAEAVPGLLAAAGWPGFRELSSLAFQARERWEALLADIAALGSVAEPLPWTRFVHELAHAAHKALFAAESRSAPVQILGIPEAAGLRFDAVWLLQANEGRWPGAGRLHPLLAPGLQRDAAMPHASPEGDLALAEIQLRRILASAPVALASYARVIEGSPARPSPLLKHFAAEPEPAQAPCVPDLCETCCEPDHAPLPSWPGERPAGGSEVLKHQAACGFQAFAAKRLGAQPLDGEAWGLEAGERATLLHRALERLWTTEPTDAPSPRMHTHADLRQAMGDGSLDGKLRAAIQSAFAATLRASVDDRWRTAYLELEQRRLHTRLRRWLDEESERPPFAVIALEQRLENVQVGPLRLNLRVDRIDRLENGRRFLLDYKTADRVHTRLWSGDRPDEPQLPIYALFGMENGGADLAGIAFAQIRTGKAKTKLHALVETGADESGRQRAAFSFSAEVREGWAAALVVLAREFVEGAAPVNPKHGAQTCRLCGLHGVCRVRSRAGALPLEEEDEDA